MKNKEMAFASSFAEVLDHWSLVGRGGGASPNFKTPSFERELVRSGSPTARNGVGGKETEIGRETGVQA